MSPEPTADRGQALVVIVAILGLVAVVVASLGEANARIAGAVRAQRGAEAAAEAAGAVVADRLAEWPALFSYPSSENRDPFESLLEDPALLARAEEAAREVAAANGGALERIALERRADELSVRVEVVRNGVRAVARVGVRSR